MNILEVFFWYCKYMGIMGQIYKIYQSKNFGYWRYDYINGSRYERCGLKKFLVKEHKNSSLKDMFWSIQRYSEYHYRRNDEKYKKARARWNAFVKNNLIYDPSFIKEGEKITFYGVAYTVIGFDEYGLIKVQNNNNGFASCISPFEEGLRFESDEIREPKFLIKKNRKIYGTRKE